MAKENDNTDVYMKLPIQVGPVKLPGAPVVGGNGQRQKQVEIAGEVGADALPFGNGEAGGFHGKIIVQDCLAFCHHVGECQTCCPDACSLSFQAYF